MVSVCNGLQLVYLYTYQPFDSLSWPIPIVLIVRHCSKDAESFSVYCSCGYKKVNSAYKFLAQLLYDFNFTPIFWNINLNNCWAILYLLCSFYYRKKPHFIKNPEPTWLWRFLLLIKILVATSSRPSPPRPFYFRWLGTLCQRLEYLSQYFRLSPPYLNVF